MNTKMWEIWNTKMYWNLFIKLQAIELWLLDEHILMSILSVKLVLLLD